MLPAYLVGLLSAIAPGIFQQPPPEHAQHPRLTFQLRHRHAADDSKVVFSDVPAHLQGDGLSLSSFPSYDIPTRRVKSYRPSSIDAFHSARLRSARFRQSEPLRWDEDEIIGPDTELRETLQLLAKMTNNAYLDPSEPGWYELGNNWTISYPFGWEPDADGFRGHVFATSDNRTVVLSIKGTSAAVVGGGGPTARKDKLNDNLLFSCCCARVDWTWTTVCDCYKGGWSCDLDCVQTALLEESLFYPTGVNLYRNVTYMYPGADIWVIGHSLGGALASLLSITFGVPSVSFEAPGERMAASRLHLPSPPSTHHITHVYHTADPIAMGVCNGYLSSCAIAGYAMESKCHLGKSIIYDTISNMSWSADIRTHTISTVIERILANPWVDSEKRGREVPEPVSEDDCVECFNWEFLQLNMSSALVKPF